ncbi:hypothetical protein Q5691_12320 [Microcoleus sp. w1-18aA5]|uniref:hypothetical protein n=1 Tax=Microcoleus sp. w2-18aC6 TaxID=2818997 RepID=UPI002FD585D8
MGGGSCDEAETQIVRFGNHRGFSPVRMSTQTQSKVCEKFDRTPVFAHQFSHSRAATSKLM